MIVPFLLCSKIIPSVLQSSPMGKQLPLQACMNCVHIAPHKMVNCVAFNSPLLSGLITPLGKTALHTCGSNTYLIDDRHNKGLKTHHDTWIRYCAFCHRRRGLDYKTFSAFYDYNEKELRASLLTPEPAKVPGEFNQEPECKCNNRLIGFGMHEKICKFPEWNRKHLAARFAKQAVLASHSR